MPLTNTMRWLETERDMGPFVLLWGALGWGVGIAVFFISNWLMAVLAGLSTVGILSMLVEVVSSWRIPKDTRRAAETAVAAFKSLYPDCKLASVALRAVEENRFVYSLRYDGPRNIRSTPQARRYFAVSRDDDSNVVELENWDWWPRGLK